MARRKCVYPFPVLIVDYDDRQIRVSFWQPLGKPWDWLRARQLAAEIGARRPVIRDLSSKSTPARIRSLAIHHQGKTIRQHGGADFALAYSGG